MIGVKRLISSALRLTNRLQSGDRTYDEVVDDCKLVADLAMLSTGILLGIGVAISRLIYYVRPDAPRLVLVAPLAPAFYYVSLSAGILVTWPMLAFWRKHGRMSRDDHLSSQAGVWRYYRSTPMIAVLGTLAFFVVVLIA